MNLPSSLFHRQRVRSLTEPELHALTNLEALLLQATTKEEFILYCQAIDSFSLTNRDFRLVICHMEDSEPIKEQALSLNVIRKRK